MRALVTTLGVVLTLGIAVGGLPAESGAAQATRGCPATAQAGQQFTIEIAIDVGTTPRGAYDHQHLDHDDDGAAERAVPGGLGILEQIAIPGEQHARSASRSVGRCGIALRTTSRTANADAPPKAKPR